MLHKLFIQNYAIIDKLEIIFSSGLNTITGETGAGKSIMLGALQLTLGARADRSVLYDQGKKAIAEAVYSHTPAHLKELLAANDIDIYDETILRREISASGKSRAFINDTPVKLNLMRKVSDLLIDLHQQFESLEIQQANRQYDMLDSFAGIAKEVGEYRRKFDRFVELGREIEAMKDALQRNARERDFLQYELEELENNIAEPDEFEQWESEFNFQENASDLLVVLNNASEVLTLNDDSLTESLRRLAANISDFKGAGHDVETVRERLESLLVEMEDLGQTVVDIAEKINPDPEALENLEEKINAVRKLLLKHGFQDVTQLHELKAAHESKLAEWDSSDDALQSKETEYHTLQKALETAAAGISASRSRSSKTLSDRVEAMLRELEMKNARFEISIEPSSSLHRNGADDIDFLFAANKGGRLESVGRVASGGEISRLNLCLKSVVSKSMDLPSLVFDEIDSGVSGQVALKMGKMLRQLSADHQVIMITHSPQIAAQGDNHYFVAKRDLPDRTVAQVFVLKGDERVREIAKMLSGDPPPESAILNAKELLTPELTDKTA